MRLILGAAWVTAICLPGPDAGAQNLLVNGNFENPANNPGNGSAFYSGWSELWNFGTAGQDGVNRDGTSGQNWGTEVANPFAGSVSAKNFFDGGILQDVAVIGGQQYVFSGATYVPLGGAADTSLWGVFTTVKWFNNVGGELSQFLGLRHDNEPRDEWTTFSDPLSAPAGAVSARIQIGTYSSDPLSFMPANPTRFDDISFAQIPEPRTAGLLAAGLGMVAAAFLRRIRV